MQETATDDGGGEGAPGQLCRGSEASYTTIGSAEEEDPFGADVPSPSRVSYEAIGDPMDREGTPPPVITIETPYDVIDNVADSPPAATRGPGNGVDDELMAMYARVVPRSQRGPEPPPPLPPRLAGPAAADSPWRKVSRALNVVRQVKRAGRAVKRLRSTASTSSTLSSGASSRASSRGNSTHSSTQNPRQGDGAMESTVDLEEDGFVFVERPAPGEGPRRQSTPLCRSSGVSSQRSSPGSVWSARSKKASNASALSLSPPKDSPSDRRTSNLSHLSTCSTDSALMTRGPSRISLLIDGINSEDPGIDVITPLPRAAPGCSPGGLAVLLPVATPGSRRASPWCASRALISGRVVSRHRNASP